HKSPNPGSLFERQNARQRTKAGVKDPVRIGRLEKQVLRAPRRGPEMFRPSEIVRVGHSGGRRTPERKRRKQREHQSPKNEPAVLHFFFFFALPAGFDLALLAGFLAADLVVAPFLDLPAPLANALSQFSQNAGVVPVRTIGPPMKLAPVLS